MTEEQKRYFDPLTRDEVVERFYDHDERREIVRVYDDDTESVIDSEQYLAESLADPNAEFAIDKQKA